MKKTIEELQEKQALPLSLKVALTKDRIRAWVKHWGIDGVYCSFSGGKDSTVLLDICRKMYPEMKAVYIDTGLEFPQIREFVKTFDNVDIVKPKMNFKDVIKTYGYPFISKEVSECVYGARKYLTDLMETEMLDRPTDRPTDRRGTIPTTTISCVELENILETRDAINSDKLANILDKRMHTGFGGSNQRLAIMLGWLTKESRIKAIIPSKDRSSFSQERYKFLLYAPFETSNRCCSVMKKSPVHEYGKATNRKPLTGQMASESKLRTQKWLQHGCNAFEGNYPISNPMAFWTEQDALLYIRQNNLPIASVYGDVLTEDEKAGQVTIGSLMGLEEKELFDLEQPTLCTTGCERTGCIFCMYGAHLDKRPNRLETMLEVTNPNLYDYMMRGGSFDEDGLWKPDNRGLGFWFPILWIESHSKLRYNAPRIEEYRKKYGTEETERHLNGILDKSTQ